MLSVLNFGRMKDSELIDKLGGTAAVAELCEVTLSAVSQWRTEGIPKARLMFLKAVRPEIFIAVTEKAA